jgi:hypothetical protein
MGERFVHNCPFMSRMEALVGTQLIYYDSLRVLFGSHCPFSSYEINCADSCDKPLCELLL